MTGTERFRKALNGEDVDRPPFEPAIYEHKAFLIGAAVSEVARSADLLLKALHRELELYGADAVTVGVDVYNVEIEALGAELDYEVGQDELPHPKANLLESPAEVTALPLPNPDRDGRMPLLLDVAEQLNREVGQEVVVRGAVSGPFSLAAELLGTERMLMALLDDPAMVTALLGFASEVAVRFGLAFARRGVAPVYFDSRCAPPLVSPNQYRELVFPHHKRLISETKVALRGQHVPLIIGGDTTAIASAVVDTGADYVLCDYTADFGAYRRELEGRPVLVRRNLDPGLVRRGPVEAIREAAMQSVREARGWPRFVMGTGIVPWDTPPEHVLAAKDAVVKAGGEEEA